MRAIGGQEKFWIIDIAAPAAEFAGFIVTDGYPESGMGQLLQTIIVDVRRGIKRGADAERQPGKAFEHRVATSQKWAGQRTCLPGRKAGGTTLSLGCVFSQSRIVLQYVE